MVSFSSLLVHIYFSLGTYKIEFICDGVSIFSSNIQVSTSVRNLEFIAQPPLFFSTDSDNMNTDFIPVIRIYNISGFDKKINTLIINILLIYLGKPIRGKTPTVTFVEISFYSVILKFCHRLIQQPKLH